jgi:hypothetical protein
MIRSDRDSGLLKNSSFLYASGARGMGGRELSLIGL